MLLESHLSAGEVATYLERWLPTAFDLDSELIRVLVLDATAYLEVIADAPPAIGTKPEKYRYDVGFYVGVTAAEVEPYMSVNPDVDEVAYGERAFYYRRLSALASRTRLTRVMGTPIYASLTLRNWRTTMSLAGMLELRDMGSAPSMAASDTEEPTIDGGGGAFPDPMPLPSPAREQRSPGGTGCGCPGEGGPRHHPDGDTASTAQVDALDESL